MSEPETLLDKYNAERNLDAKAERVKRALEHEREQQKQFYKRATHALSEAFRITEGRLLVEMQAEEEAQQLLVDAEEPAEPRLHSPAVIGLDQHEYPKALSSLVMPMIRSVCLSNEPKFSSFVESDRGGIRHVRDRNSLTLLHPDVVPINLRNARAEVQQVEAWAHQGTQVDLSRLDQMTWDIVTMVAVAFNIRTKHRSVDERFMVMNRDYFVWCGWSPQSITPALRQDVDDRLQLLFQAQLHTETQLYVTDPATGRKNRMEVVASGPFMVKIEQYDQAVKQGEGPPFGYLVTLGEWARKLVEEKAMLGVYPRRLATYHSQRQHWAQRIGSYLVSQWQYQGSKMQFYEEDGVPKAEPQQSLYMRTVLVGAELDWENIRAHDPGRVIESFTNALERLKQDQILADYKCLDGPADGVGLPRKGKLDKMLGYRFKFYPGPELVRHLKPKADAVQEKVARRKASAKQKS